MRSAFLLMVFASLRFADTIDVGKIWRSKTAMCGRSVNQKDPTGPTIQLAAVRKGIRSDGAWINPIAGFWGKYKPPGAGRYQCLVPYLSPTWVVGYSRQRSGNVFQHAIRRAELHLGFPPMLTRHSPRTWFATCARQLLVSKGERNMLGHWAPNSDMPEHYDRAYCATELRIRNSVFLRVADGWVPARAFEVPNGPDEKGAGTPLESPSVGDTSETSSGIIGEMRGSNITDLPDVVLTPPQPYAARSGKRTGPSPRRRSRKRGYGGNFKKNTS